MLLFAIAAAWTAWVPRPAGFLMGLSGLTYLVQGWVAGTEGFSETHTIAIMLAWILNLACMVWLIVAVLSRPPFVFRAVRQLAVRQLRGQTPIPRLLRVFRAWPS